jgi:hypothetical protein
MSHPLYSLLVEACEGRFPPVDGGVTVVDAPDMVGGHEAIVAFTGHAVVSTTRSASKVLGHGGFDGFGGAHHPDAIRWLAGPGGWIGSLDQVFVSLGAGQGQGQRLNERSDLDDHYRVKHARDLRHDVRVFGDERGLVTVGRGMVGRWEMSVEVDAGARSRGAGRSLIADAVTLVPAGELLFAEVAPGNVASIRAFLAVGFVPICSEVVVGPDRKSRLLEAVRDLASLLDGYGETNWAPMFGAFAGRIERGEVDSQEAARQMLGMYGGMGSLSDVVIHIGNGHRVTEANMGPANDRLDELRAYAWQEARAIKE